MAAIERRCVEILVSSRLALTLHIRLRPVGPLGLFLLPFSPIVLVEDGGVLAGDALLAGGKFRGPSGGVMAGKGLGVGSANAVGPAAVVLDDLVGQLRHGSAP